MLSSELQFLRLDPVFQIIMRIYFDLAFNRSFAVVFVVALAHNLVYLKVKLVPDVCLFFKLFLNKTYILKFVFCIHRGLASSSVDVCSKSSDIVIVKVVVLVTLQVNKFKTE